MLFKNWLKQLNTVAMVSTGTNCQAVKKFSRKMRISGWHSQMVPAAQLNITH